MKFDTITYYQVHYDTDVIFKVNSIQRSRSQMTFLPKCTFPAGVIPIDESAS